MIRLFLFLLLLLALTLSASWLAGHPGEVSILWLNRRVDTSLAALFVVMLIVSLFSWSLARLITRMGGLRGRWRERRSLKHYKLGLQAVTQSIAALAAGDAGQAKAQIGRAKKQLGDTPLTLLLSVQLARAEGQDGQTQALLEKMLTHAETEYIAAKSLSDQALKKRELAKALSYAEQAARVNPKEKAALLSLIGLHARLKQWEEAHGAIARAQARNALLSPQAKRLTALLQLARARTLAENGHAEQAVYLARQAQSALPQFAPASALLSELLIKENDRAGALRVWQKAWKVAPHVELIPPVLALLEHDTPQTAIKTIRKLTASHPESAESHLAIAQLAARLAQWEDAKKECALALARRESKAACLLMADILTRGFDDTQQANHWLSRANTALPGAAYRCCDCLAEAANWQLFCSSCERFDALSWREQELQLAI